MKAIITKVKKSAMGKSGKIAVGWEEVLVDLRAQIGTAKELGPHRRRKD
jgi:hypothetical protein